MSLVRFSPARDLGRIENEFSQLFRALGTAPDGTLTTGGYVPSLDVHETKEAYTVAIELPGMSQSDVKVTVVDNNLVIKGEKKVERDSQSASYHRTERSYGRFERVLQLGAKVESDKVTASLKDGVLTITVPKAPDAREREIQINLN